MLAVRASSSDAITPINQQPSPTATQIGRWQTPAAATAARRRDLKPSLVSHISGVHLLSGVGADPGVSSGTVQAARHDATKQLPKYGVDCSDKALLDEVRCSLRLSE